MASLELEDYPNEKIVFIKFLDDNDPRLLLLVTYNSELDTTYMKVLKIEKANKCEQQQQPDVIGPQIAVETPKGITKREFPRRDSEDQEVTGFAFWQRRAGKNA